MGSSSNISIILDDMICSDPRAEGPCQTDSGGPLMYEVRGVWYQAGVISWGYGCTDIERAAVYAMVPTYISWIQSYVPELTPHNVGSFSNPSIDCDKSYMVPAVPDVSSPDSRAAGSVCGSPMVFSRTVNGTDAVPGEWPWQVSVQYLLPGHGYYHICGGSLIASQWVLTASHCIVDYSPNNYLVILGGHKLQDLDSNAVTMEVQRFFKHSFHILTGGDISLIKLLSP
ncbi:transmembrane protease serine 9-like, partial [Hyla sarda]|uniref:transmembrane protease serine 9-like n=1 Tax=Hyla sarda TaxID=327740 RepID=UPI0024C2DC50